jgi:hypothetical protein
MGQLAVSCLGMYMGKKSKFTELRRICGPKQEEGATDQNECKMWRLIFITFQYISNGQSSRKS